MLKNKKGLFLVEQALFYLVPRVGIEPTLPKKLDFESSASTSSAIPAFKRAIIRCWASLGKYYLCIAQ